MNRTLCLMLLLGGTVAGANMWRAEGRPLSGAALGTSLQENHPAAPPSAPPAGQAATALHLYHHPEELPAWCAPYGKEFWRRAPAAALGASKGKSSSTSTAPAFDLGEVIGRVSHAFAAEPAGGAAAVRAKTYTARIEGRAIQLSFESQSPRRLGEIAFETASIRQDNRLLYSADGAAPDWAVLGNTAQTLLGPSQDLVQHLEARREGIAATWLVRQAPGGHGDLVVEARLTGLTYAGETPQGHHFADASGTARWRVGRVTIADARGATWPGALQVHDRSLLVTVSHTILSQAAYPLAIDPVISPEFGMDVPVLVAAPAAQQNPAVAANGADFLVVWEDARLASTNGPSIYGSRVTGDGLVEDPGGIALSPAGASSPAVAANGTGFLVVWSDGRNVAASGLDIYGARVGGSGQVIDPGGVPICMAAGDQLSPAATANGGDSFVVWQDGRNIGNGSGPSIYGARVTSGGVVSDPAGIPLRAGAGIQATPAAAFNGENLLVVWSEQEGEGDFEIHGTRVSPTGQVLDSDGLVISSFAGGEFYPQVGANGTNYLVVWEDHRNEGVGFVDIFAELVTGSGSLLERDGFPISTGLADGFTPAVAAGLTDYLVVWQDSRNLASSGEDVFGARVSLSGEVTDANGFAVSTAAGDQTTPALAFNGSQYLAVWSDQRNLPSVGPDIYGTMVSTEAAVSSPAGLLIGSGSADEQHPAVAFNGDNYLVVWEDDRNSATNGLDILGVRVAAAGGVLDLNALSISVAAGDQTLPVVAASGSGYLVAWQDYRNASTSGADIYGTRVSDAGVVLDPLGLPISTNSIGDQLAPALAGDGTNFFVVWQDGRNLANEGVDIYGARVNASGAVLDAQGLPLSQAAGDQYAPAVAFNGATYLVVWSDERNLATAGVQVYGSRVSPAGAVLDAAGIPIAQGPGDALFPAVASAGGGFLVAWEDGRNAVTTLDDIYGARVDGTGAVLDPAGIPIAVEPGPQAAPAVTSTGNAYWVVWQDGRNSDVTGWDIYGARVEADGTVADPAGLAVNAGASDQQFPKLTAGSAGRVLVVCQSQENGAQRAVGNFVSLNAATPRLTIQSQTNGLAVTWPASAAGYVLQWTADLASPILWQPVPSSEVFANGDQFEFLVQPTSSPEFFRLAGSP